MENNVNWHHKAPSAKNLKLLLKNMKNNKIDFRNAFFDEMYKISKKK